MKNKNQFTGKHILITGAARGIGLEIAKQFADAGATLSLFDINEENLTKAANELEKTGATIYSYVIDLTSRNLVFETVNKIEGSTPIDILVNNAGIAYETPFLNIEEDEWKRVIDTNLNAMFYVAQSVARHMAKRKKGVVINMSSKNGLDGEFGFAHYNASKGAIIMLTKTMALELAHLGIRVNAVCPGYIQTPMSMEIDSPTFTVNFVNRYIPMNRPGTVADVAPIFLFLAGEESSFITGQTFIVDGGQLAGQKPGNDLLGKINLESK